MSDKPFAAATERNSQPILGVIKNEFRDLETILEIGSGTGQHAVFFGAELEHLTWQTSDMRENHDGIHAWLREASLPNVLEPLTLDVLTAEIPTMKYDGVYSANTAHIMSFEAVEKMFSLVSSVLGDKGVFVLYGPFRQDGKFNTQSNADFDDSLRQRDPQMGIRDIEELDRLAQVGCMQRVRFFALPANNHIAVWVKDSSEDVQ
jgi:cyclopropane fatty-acyl-phospholipid synthase-like methyltransferase